MPTKAPPIAGPDLTGGPDFDLAQHKGAYVFVSFEGYPWCDPCKVELPHLLALADEYTANQSVPPVHFVIVNFRLSSSLASVQAFAKQEGITIPIVDDDNAAIQQAYSGLDYSLTPQTFIVRPTGFLCDESLSGLKTADELQALLATCGAPAPGEKGVSYVDLGSQPPPVVAVIPNWPPEIATPIKGPPQPWPREISLMSRQLLRALSIHDSASGLADHEARSAVRKTALKSAAEGLKRMEKASMLTAAFGRQPPFVMVKPRTRKRSAK